MPSRSRLYMSDQKLGDALGFASTANFHSWLDSRLVKPYLDFYEQHTRGLRAEKEGKKGSEYTTVERLLAAGESGGKQRYSRDIIDDGDMVGWTLSDHQARLVYKLTSVNTDNFQGPFYGKNLSKSYKMSLMWDIYLRYNWKNAPSKRRAISVEKVTHSSSASSPSGGATLLHPVTPPLRTEGATFRIIWENIPNDASSTAFGCIIENVDSYTENEFRQEIVQRLGLSAYGAMIVEVDYHEESSFQTAVNNAVTYQERKNVSIYTGNSSETILPELFEHNLVRQLDPKLEMDRMIAEFNDTCLVNVEDTRLYRWRICQAVGLSSNIRPDVITARARNVDLELDPYEENIQWTQELRRQSRTLEDQTASEPLLNEITQEEISSFRTMEAWLENSECERDGLVEHCQMLGIADTERPFITGMSPTLTLKFWQPITVAFILQKENSFTRGCVISDQVGLGKTYEALAAVLIRLNERKAAMQNGEAVLPPRATLIIMPAYLIEQWVDSITRFSDDFRVLVYHGSAKGSNVHKAQLQADTLCRADLLNGHEDWARTLIVTSYQTMTARHGRKSIKQSIKVLLQTQRPDLTSVERNKEAERMLQDADSTSPLPLLPQNLRQCFERVILDEAHEVRNQETQNSWTIQNLRAQNNILLTATPFINTVEDIAGLVKILRPDEDELWRKENLKKLGVILTDDTGQEQETIDPDCFNPWTLDDPSEPGYDLRWTSISLRHHIFSQKSTLAEKGAVMRPIFKEFILKRGYPSKVDGKRIGDELPPVQNITVYLKFTQLEQDYYQPIFEKYLKKLFRKRGESIVYDTNSFRLLTLLTSWLGFERLASTYKVKMLKDFGRRGGNAMTILADLLSAEKKAGIPPTEQTSMPHPNDIQGILAVFARGSPKLRYLLLTIAELVILKAEKMLIFVGLPAQQTWLECIIKLLGVNVESLRADLTPKERSELIADFRSNEYGIQIIVLTFTIGVSGLNFQNMCRNIVFFDGAPNIRIERQAIGRIRRLGQTRWVRVIRFLVKDSFSTRMNAMLLVKSLPGLMTELNAEKFFESDTEDITLEPMAICEGKLVAITSNPSYAELEPLTADQTLVCLQKLLRGEKLEIDEDTHEYYQKRMKYH